MKTIISMGGLERGGFKRLGKKENENAYKGGRERATKCQVSGASACVLQPSGEEQKGQGGKRHISEPKDDLLSG